MTIGSTPAWNSNNGKGLNAGFLRKFSFNKLLFVKSSNRVSKMRADWLSSDVEKALSFLDCGCKASSIHLVSSSLVSFNGLWVLGSIPWCLSFFFRHEFQRFLISLSVLPGNCAAIWDHLHSQIIRNYNHPYSLFTFKWPNLIEIQWLYDTCCLRLYGDW